MKTEANDLAFPIPGTISEGLTKRELFAVIALQGMLAGKYEGNNIQDDANASVNAADALIKALNETK